ncbi:HNH endonuclease [Streptomyces sp. NPDC086776]|uniref:HNH endonuclease n=1 Tax=Streptomyces sp. NPDC086776 TaxID=3365756 RepID=UPI0038082D50
MSQAIRPKTVCVDCGNPVSKPTYKRCHACNTAMRRAAAPSVCAVTGCGTGAVVATVKTWGPLCSKHHQRWCRHGDPRIRLVAGDDTTVNTLVRCKVDASGGPDACWPYTGEINRWGYGTLCLDGRGGPRMAAHRFLWGEEHGPVPEDVEIDHTCHNAAVARGECAGGSTCLHRRCCNLRHLRAVDHEANTLAGVAPTAINSRKTHCLRAHPFKGPGADVRITRNGWQRCLHCERIRDRERRQRTTS